MVGPQPRHPDTRLSDLLPAMKQAGSRLDPVGTETAVYGSAFMSAYDGYLHSGRFNLLNRDRMFRYKVGSDGSLTLEGGKAYLVYESGSHLYRGTALNVITRLHTAALSTLTALA